MPNTMAMFTRTLETVGKNTTTGVGIPLTNPSRTGRAQRIISNEREVNPTSNEHHLNKDHRKRAARIALVKAAVTIDPVKLALSVPVAATTDPVVVVGVEPVIWIAGPRNSGVAIFRTRVSKTSKGV